MAAKPARFTCMQQLMSSSSRVVRPARADTPVSVTRQHWLMLIEVSRARAGSGSAPSMEEGRCADIIPGCGAPIFSSASRI